MLAAPEPISVMRLSLGFLPTSLKAFIKPARMTVAVPCWSSCHTGMLSCSRAFEALEAFGFLDVFEVYAAKRGLKSLADPQDFAWVFGSQADWKRVDAA